jgi:hypothetical protein
MHISRVAVRTAVIIALASILTGTAGAQPSLLLEAARHARIANGADKLLVDPRLFTGSAVLRPDGARHSDSVLAEWRTDSTLSVISPERADECVRARLGDCLSNGIMLVAALGAPTLRGDTAVISLFMHGHKAPTAGDSARVRTSLAGRDSGLVASALRRLNMGVVTNARITLVRTRTGWLLVSYVVVGQS